MPGIALSQTALIHFDQKNLLCRVPFPARYIIIAARPDNRRMNKSLLFLFLGLSSLALPSIARAQFVTPWLESNGASSFCVISLSLFHLLKWFIIRSDKLIQDDL